MSYFRKIFAVRYETVISPLAPEVPQSHIIDDLITIIKNKGPEARFHETLLRECIGKYLDKNDPPPINEIIVTMKMSLSQKSKIWKIKFPGFVYGSISSHFLGWEGGPSLQYRLAHASPYREEGRLRKIPELGNAYRVEYGLKYFPYDFQGKYTQVKLHQFGYFQYNNYLGDMEYVGYKQTPLQEVPKAIYQQNISEIGHDFLGKVITTVHTSSITQVIVTKVKIMSRENPLLLSPTIIIDKFFSAGRYCGDYIKSNYVFSICTNKWQMVILEGLLFDDNGILKALSSPEEVTAALKMNECYNKLNVCEPSNMLHIEDLGIEPQQKTMTQLGIDQETYSCSISTLRSTRNQPLTNLQRAWGVVSRKIAENQPDKFKMIDKTLLNELFEDWMSKQSDTNSNIGVWTLFSENELTINVQKNNQTFTYKRVRLSDGTIVEGEFGKNPNTSDKTLINGRKIFRNLTIYEGKFEYNGDLNNMMLVKGQKKLPDKRILDGTFSYDPQLKAMCLVGSVQHPDVPLQTGTFWHNLNFQPVLIN